MSIKFADEIVKSIEERMKFQIPDDCVTGEEFEKWLKREYMNELRISKETKNYYHLSEIGNLEVLTPRVPESLVAMWEDNKIKRVCFSDSIEGCLSALQMPGKYYVYTPRDVIHEDFIHYPTVDEVRDAKFTHEVWVLTEVPVKCIGIIETPDIYVKERCDSGRGIVNIFHYDYEWLKKYKDEVND